MAIQVNGEFIENERFHRAFLELSGGRTPEQMQNAPRESQSILHQAEKDVLHAVLLQQFAAAEGIKATAEDVDEERHHAWAALPTNPAEAVCPGHTHGVTVRKADRFLTCHVQRPDRAETE